MTAPWRLVGWRRGCAGLHFPALSIFMAGLLAAVAARGGEPAFDEIDRVPGFLKGTSPPTAAEVDAAIRRGVEFLLKVQEKDGSWGSPRNTKGLNIYAPVPGAHHAFRAADTALCYAALFEVGGDSEEVRRALDRA